MKKLLIISAISSVLFAFGGACDGVTQALLFHYSEVDKHVDNEQYWNPDLSWLNKYKNYEAGDTRAKFFGSTTFLVFTTDAYHLFRFLFGGFAAFGWLCFAIGFLVIWSNLKIWSIPYTLSVWYISKAIGFHLIYTFVF